MKEHISIANINYVCLLYIYISFSLIIILERKHIIIFRMGVSSFLNRPACIGLMVLLGVYKVFTTEDINESLLLRSTVNRQARQPRCKIVGGVIDCYVDMLEDNIDFQKYTGQIDTVELYCDKSKFLPSKLSDGFFEPLGHTLEFIEINDCYFVDISRGAFRGLADLRTLNIKGVSNFQMGKISLDILSTLDSTIQSETDIVLPRAKSMARQGSLVLPDDVFSELNSLTRLDLVAMRLNGSVWHEIEHLGNLKYLYLSNNDITTIDIDSSSKLKNLRILDLASNFIQIILNGSLELTSISLSLDLSSNKIRFIERDAFKGLHKLKRLVLSDNFIRSFEVNIFKELSSLYILDLSGNSIQVVKKGMLKGLGTLGKLDLSKNNISIIEMDSFEGLVELNTLSLSRNSIDDVEIETFKRLHKLGRLDLSWNRIRDVELGTFNELSNLHFLDLSGNRIRTVKINTFEGLTNLLRLSMAENQITTIVQHTLNHLRSLIQLNLSYNQIQILPKFPKSLTSLDLRHNDIKELDNNSFVGLSHLHSLDLSYNQVNECRQYSIPDTVNKLNLSSNNMSVVSVTLTHGLRYADLRKNQLKSLAIDGLKEYRYSYKSGDIYLSGNPDTFRCVCYLDVVNNGSTFNYDSWKIMKYHIKNFTLVNCSLENKFESGGIIKIHLETFSCQYKKSCPDYCTCYHWQYKDNINIVSCQNASLTSVPVNISTSCTILDLSGNMFSSLTREKFDGLPKLVELFLNSSNITEIKDGTFSKLSYLTKLDLSNNSFIRLKLETFTGLNKLSSLDLSLNKISVVVESIFNSLTALKDLNLAGNEVKHISSSVIDRMYTMASLKLANNPWSCDCSFLELFKPFISEREKHINDYFDIVCVTSNKTEYHLYQIDLGKFCPDIKQPKQTTKAEIALYTLVSVAIFSIICFCIMFKNREFFKVWLFIKFGWKSANSESEEMNKQYDAFVSYSSRDEEFILGELMPRLEQPLQDRLGYKLCVHFRDFPVGRHIPETIHNAVENSRRVIMILSDNFLSSEWCQYEFQAAHHRLLTEKRNRIIMVLLHDLNNTLLDRQLKMYLRTRTYVKYGDALFWDKLEYAMPERELPAEDTSDAENNGDQVDSIPATAVEEMDDDVQLIH